MGGFYNTVAKFATEGIEKAGAKIGQSAFAHEAAENVEKGLYHAVFPAKTAFQDIPAAKALYDIYSGPYKETVNKLTSQGVQAAQAMGSVKPHHEISSEAAKTAQDMVFGKNRAAIQGVLKHVENTVSKNRADILADHLNILFKESPDSQGLSSFDRDMRKGTPDQKVNTPPSPYRGANFYEKNIGRTHQALLAYKAAIPHLASNLNILISDGFQTYAKVVNQNFNPSTRKGAEAAVLATNAISELWHTSYKEKQEFDKGLISKYAPGGVGEFLHRNMYIPGMSRVRYETLMMSAHASKLAAEEASQHLMQGNDKMALPMLRELGLDANKIKRQNGQLLSDDIDKVYYHGTNARAFLNFAENRTALFQRSPLFRTAGAFHNYVSSQSQFFRNVFKRQYEQGDFMGITRNIGLLSMAFPVVGATIYESERLLSGNDWDNPTGHLEKRLEDTPAGAVYDEVAGRQKAGSAAHIALGTIENLSHIAAFGVATGYVRGASRANLAGQVLGPDANIALQGAQDALKSLHTSNRKPDAWKPVARDAMSDFTPLGIGSIASHKLLPTKQDRDAKKFHKPRLKKQQSDNNPLNSNDFKY